MAQFQLFRIRVERPEQPDLRDRKRSPRELLVEAIKERPEAELYRGSVWHIGNIAEIDDQALYFRVGRVKEAQVEKFKGGDFVDQESDVAPYTHAILDVPLQMCAIGSNTKVANTIEDIANRLARLLGNSTIGVELGYSFVSSSVKDPKPFLSHVREAHRIESYRVTFSPPNILDAERDFFGPFSRYAEAANAKKGETQVTGESLDKEAIEDITRTAASAGEDASAKLVPEEGRGAVEKSLKDNPARLEGQAETRDGQRGLLDRIRELYEEIKRRK